MLVLRAGGYYLAGNRVWDGMSGMEYGMGCWEWSMGWDVGNGVWDGMSGMEYGMGCWEWKEGGEYDGMQVMPAEVRGGAGKGGAWFLRGVG